MSALRELLAIFDIKVNDGELKKADKSIGEFGERLAKVARTVTEAFAVREVYEFVESQIDAAAHVQDLANRLDISATAINNFGFVAKQAGVDTDSAARSLGFLEKSLGEAQLKGGESAQAFARLGVSLKDGAGQARPLNDVLGDLAEGISKLPDQNQRAALAMQVLGREGKALVPVFLQGREALKAALEEAGALGNGLGDTYFADAKKAREESEKLARIWQSLAQRVTSTLLPAVTWLTGELKNASRWMLEHAKTTETLEYAVEALAAVIGVALVDALIGAAIAAGELLLPFAPIAATIAAVVFVVRDLNSLLQGTESVIGDVADKIGGLGTRTQLVVALNAAWVELKGDIDQVAYGLGYFTGLWIGLGKALKSAGGAVLHLSPVFAGIGEALDNANVTAVIFLTTLNAIKETILSFIPGLGILRAAGTALGIAHGATVATDVTTYGVPKEIAREAAAKPRPGPYLHPEEHPESRYEDYTSLFPRDNARFKPPNIPGVVSAPLFHAPQFGGGGAGAHIEQHNENHVVVHTASDQPNAVGHAVGAGVATATQKDLNAALASVNKP